MAQVASVEKPTELEGSSSENSFLLQDYAADKGMADEPSQIRQTVADAGQVGPQSKEARASEVERDEFLVTLQGDEDPKNWSLTQKWALTLLTSFGGLVCLMSSTMLAPALGNIARDFDISQDKANMALSIFVLAFAFGPMVLAPLAEVFGRRRIWLLSSLWYTAWSIICGFSHTHGLLLAARLFAGLGSSAEFAISNPVLGDIWKSEQRGHSFAIATFLPLLGPAIGPVIGGVVTSSIGWRWLFFILAMFDGCLVIVAFFAFPETYSHLLLRRKAARLTKETGQPYYTSFDIDRLSLGTKLKHGLLRPTRLLVTQPTIQLMGVFMAFNYGTLFLVLTSYASIWTSRYGESVSVSGLHYFALVVGYTVAAQGGARATDRLWQHLKTRAGGQTAPEYRVPLMIPGNVLVPVGLLWYGWAAQTHQYWVLVDAGAAIFGCGIILSTQAMQQYVMESYRDYVASASAASQFLRSIFGFCFPLFAPAIYSNLGFGWGNTTIALIFISLAVPGPFILWFYGANLRAKGAAIK